jgi:hypothetical protein
MAIEVNGKLVDRPVADPPPVGTEAFGGTGPYTCNSTTFTATAEGVTSTWDRTG